MSLTFRSLLLLLLTFYATCIEVSQSDEKFKSFTSSPNYAQQNIPQIKNEEELNPKYLSVYTPISMNINEEMNKNTRLLGVDGTLYFITDYIDTENIFSSPDIEENSKFKGTIIDEKENQYEVNCRLFNPKEENIVVLCRLEGNLKNENNLITLNEISFIYNETYNVSISSKTSIKVNQLNYRIPFIYGEKQIWDLDNIFEFKFKFKFDSYNESDIIYIHGIQNDYMVLDDCKINKNELTCKMNTYKMKEILLKEEVIFKLGNMNDNYGIINFDLVYGIKVINKLRYPVSVSVQIQNLIGDVDNSGSTVAYEVNAVSLNMNFSTFFNLKFSNGEQKCFLKYNFKYLLVCQIIGDGEVYLETIEEIITLNFLETNAMILPVENKQKISVSSQGAFFDFVYPNKLNYNFGTSFTIRYITSSPEKIKNIKLDLDSPSFLECVDLVGMKKCTVPFDHFKPTEEESFVTPTYYLNYLNSYSAKYEIDHIQVFTPDPPQIYFNMNITDENNKDIIKVGTNGILYFITDYFDTENVLNETVLEQYIIFLYTSYNVGYRKIDIKSDCKIWKSKSMNVMIICQLDKNFVEGEHQIHVESTNIRLKRAYNITLNFQAQNLKVKQLTNSLPFIYSSKYVIDLNQVIDYYSFEFNHYDYDNNQYEQKPLYLYKTNMRSTFLNITDYKTFRKIYCNIEKKALIDILSYSGEKFGIAFPTKTEGLYVADFVEIVVNYKIEKKEISLSIGNLLTKSIYKNDFIIYETNIYNKDNISAFTTDYFDIKTNKNDIQKCMLKKSNNQDKLLLLCIANSSGEGSLGKLELMSLDNINILYKFTIKASENNEIFKVSDENNGSKISGVTPLLVNLTDEYSSSFTLTYATENPDGFNNIKLGSDLKELTCQKGIGYIKCSGNRNDFKSGTGYYNTYHSNPLGESVISHETPRIYVILPEEEGKYNLGLIIGLSAGGILILVGLVILTICICKRVKKNKENVEDNERLPLTPNTANEE